MSVEKVGYSQQPNVITIEHRPCTDISDLWLVKDITAPTGDELWTAQEAYMQIPTIECPSRETVEADFNSWFVRASRWPESTDTDRIPNIETLLLQMAGVL